MKNLTPEKMRKGVFTWQHKKLLFLGMLLCLVSVSCSKARIESDGSAPSSSKNARVEAEKKPARVRGVDICRTASAQIGVSYKYGGTSPKTGFDCSGLLYWVYAQYGVKLPRTAVEQSKHGAKVSKGNLVQGDIVAFKPPFGYHTGIYSGNGRFVHSPSNGGKVREDTLEDPYWSRYYIGARRVF